MTSRLQLGLGALFRLPYQHPRGFPIGCRSGYLLAANDVGRGTPGWIGPVLQTEPTGPIHTSSPAPERIIWAAHATATGASSLERTVPGTMPDKSRSQVSDTYPCKTGLMWRRRALA